MQEKAFIPVFFVDPAIASRMSLRSVARDGEGGTSSRNREGVMDESPRKVIIGLSQQNLSPAPPALRSTGPAQDETPTQEHGK